jgi:hypothetical protein
LREQQRILAEQQIRLGEKTQSLLVAEDGIRGSVRSFSPTPNPEPRL